VWGQVVSSSRNNTNADYIRVKRRKREMPRYLKCILAFVGVYLLFSFLVGGYQIWQIKSEITLYNQQKVELLKTQQELHSELASLQEPEMIEKLARESLGMVKPGEILVVPAVPGDNIPRPKDVKIEDIRD